MNSDHQQTKPTLALADAQPQDWEILPIANADIRLLRDFLPSKRASQLQELLTEQVAWRRDHVQLFGKRHPIPRLHQWYGEPGAIYRWSGIEMQPQPWLDELVLVRDRLQNLLDQTFNSTLINLYRDGNDSMGWHADDEKELGGQPVIASISLGSTRDFLLRPKDKSTGATQSIPLTHGSLLLMKGQTQHQWQHSLPKRLRCREPRINLTFRQIETAAT